MVIGINCLQNFANASGLKSNIAQIKVIHSIILFDYSDMYYTVRKGITKEKEIPSPLLGL